MIAFSRRGVLQSGAAAVAAPHLWLPARAEQPVWATETVAPFIEVETASGRIRGGSSRGALAFKGIPYAGPVSGRNRFKAPRPVEPWSGVRDATRLGAPALQSPGGTYGEHEPAYAEDCLFLNVWTPALGDGGKRPVMVYCHGGQFTAGSGGSKTQDGSHLAAAYDVVVVALNHRLGLLGFLYLGELGGEEYVTSGNQGLLDIVAALRWVRTNIAQFGGDPSNVMLFGESGGGQKTSTLLAMPAAHGLFHKAAIQSGSLLQVIPKDAATETARRVLAGLGLAPHEIGKLAEVPAEKLLAIQLAGGKGPLVTPTEAWLSRPPGRNLPGDRAPGAWGPVVDGTELPNDPFDPAAPAISSNIPLIVGNTRDEFVFGMRDNPGFFNNDEAALIALGQRRFGDGMRQIVSQYHRTRPQATVSEIGIAIGTAVQFGNDTVTLADRKSLQPAPVFRYRYDFPSNVPVKGTDWTLRACHASDIPMVFLNYEVEGLQGSGPGVAEASKAMSGYFTSFARTALPSASGQPAWPRYETQTRPVMLINAQCRVQNDPDGEERRFWQSR